MRGAKEKQREALSEEVGALRELEGFVENTELKLLSPLLRSVTNQLFEKPVTGPTAIVKGEYEIKREPAEGPSAGDILKEQELEAKLDTEDYPTLFVKVPGTKIWTSRTGNWKPELIPYSVVVEKVVDGVTKYLKKNRYKYSCVAHGCTEKDRTSKWGMESHINQRHSGLRYGPCPNCENEWITPNRDSYNRHRIEHDLGAR